MTGMIVLHPNPLPMRLFVLGCAIVGLVLVILVGIVDASRD